MSFRNRVLVACLLAAVVPMTLLTVGIRREVGRRLTAQYAARVDALVGVIRQDVTRVGQGVDTRLAALEAELQKNQAVRLSVLAGEDRPPVLDWASDAMRLAGLDYLMLLDGRGRVLSSGRFRNEYDRMAPGLVAPLNGSDGPVLVRGPTAGGSFLALARGHAFAMGGRRFTLVGGMAVDRGFLERLSRGEGADGMAVSLVGAGESTEPEAEAGGAVAAELTLPFVDDTRPAPAVDTARVVVRHSLAPLLALRRRMDFWFAGGLAVALLLAVAIAQVVAARVTRPLSELATRTGRLDLDRLDVEFRSTRRDEVGTLTRVMASLVDRLRASVAQLRQAERRATVGDMARQVNHDIRNGLLPIRNVVRHLSEVAHQAPGKLVPVFAEREATLDGGISYLEGLASTYARISGRGERRPTDLKEVVRVVVRGAAAPPGVTVREETGPARARVSADPLALRRIVENLVVNAVESLDGAGAVTVSTDVEEGAEGPSVVLTVSDTGRGMEADQVERVFEDFFTTKSQGTGLGLSIVRRLVADLGGRVSAESTPGSGSRFRVVLPGLVAPMASDAGRKEDR